MVLISLVFPSWITNEFLKNIKNVRDVPFSIWTNTPHPPPMDESIPTWVNIWYSTRSLQVNILIFNQFITDDDSYGVTVRCPIRTGKIFGKAHLWIKSEYKSGGSVTKWNVHFSSMINNENNKRNIIDET